MIQDATEFLKGDDGGDEGDGNLLYVFASWLTKEGILSGTTKTMEVAEDSTYKIWSWGEIFEEGVFVEQVEGSH